MELLDIELTSFERRARTTVVAHGDTTLERGLEPGESVVLRDADGTCWSAFVADLDFDLENTRYRFTLEEAVALEVEHLALAAALVARGDEGVARVEALLHEARGLAAAPRLSRVR